MYSLESLSVSFCLPFEAHRCLVLTSVKKPTGWHQEYFLFGVFSLMRLINMPFEYPATLTIEPMVDGF